MKSSSGGRKGKDCPTIEWLPFPDEKSLELAMELAKLGLDDIESAKENYKNRRFANAAHGLQQSVEKGSKAYGLLIGTVKPEQIKRKVGHLSFRAFTLNFWNFYFKLFNAMEDMYKEIQVMEVDNSVARVLIRVLGKVMDKLRKDFPRPETDEKIEKELNELDKLDRKTMWKASLNLDMSNKWISDAVHGLKREPIISDDLRYAVKFIAALMEMLGHISIEETRRAEYTLNVGKASKLFLLGILTTWHHETARYPPVGEQDYWNPSAYKRGVPYIDQMPVFIDSAKDALDAILEACKLVAIQRPQSGT